MEFNYRYHGASTVSGSANTTDLGFAPDTLRQPTYFVGRLAQPVAFREAISALNDVVISDLRSQPKDREQYKTWLAQNEAAMLADFMADSGATKARIKEIRRELDELSRQSVDVMAPYFKAQQKYFNYLYKTDYDAWLVFDPVITVHPDEVFFECFSEDESSYGRLGCRLDAFDDVREHACGTTNIDYSAALYREFQKLRDYKTTEFAIDPSGFEIETSGEYAFKETKIDLPESWVRGFLQVSSAMSLPMRTLELHPMDMHNICLHLRRRKEQHGPRSLRFHLTPDQPVRITFEPWNFTLNCPRSFYTGADADEIRIWGRGRLMILERLIPIAEKFIVHLLGSGMPSFYIAQMPYMTFTLGLSGWVANDWSRLGAFDLMAPRGQVDEFTGTRVFNALKETWHESPDSLARRLDLDRSVVLGALGSYTQAGRAIYDLNTQSYRVRELSREPLPLAALRFSSQREENANRFVAANLVKLIVESNADHQLLIGRVLDDGEPYHPRLTLDSDERMISGQCTCGFFIRNKLHRGPCEHLLALRAQHSREQVSH